jgi:hypothetical protein
MQYVTPPLGRTSMCLGGALSLAACSAVRCMSRTHSPNSSRFALGCVCVGGAKVSVCMCVPLLMLLLLLLLLLCCCGCCVAVGTATAVLLLLCCCFCCCCAAALLLLLLLCCWCCCAAAADVSEIERCEQ